MYYYVKLYKMNIKNTNKNKNRWVVGTVPTTYPKSKYISLLDNYYYKNIIYLLLNKNFTYQKELNKIFNLDVRGYLTQLLKLGVIERNKLTPFQEQGLRVILNLTDYHINRLQAYKLTSHVRDLFMQDTFYSMVCEDIDPWIEDFKEYQTNIYQCKMLEKQEAQNKEIADLKQMIKIRSMQGRHGEAQALVGKLEELTNGEL